MGHAAGKTDLERSVSHERATFIVDKDGVVYQQDLGEKTSDLAAAIKDFNPADAWTAVE